MGFNDLITTLLADVVQPLTTSLRATVVHRALLSDDGQGDEAHQESWQGTSLDCIIEKSNRIITKGDGSEIQCSHKLTITEPLTVNGAAVRLDEPIDERDLFDLPDGTTEPVVAVSGPVNPSTGRAYFHEVLLGRAHGRA